MNNKMMGLFFLFLIVGVFSPSGIQAQGTTRFPQGNLEWTVTVKYHEKEGGVPETKDEKNPGKIAEVRIQRAGNFRKDVVRWTNGAQTETWWVQSPAFIMFEDPRIKEVVAMPPSILFNGMRFDESLFQWIGNAAPSSEVRLNGKNCFLFKSMDTLEEEGGVPRLARSEQEQNSPDNQAWIDKETGYPVAYADRVATYVFTFSETPPPALQLPERFAVLVERHVAMFKPSPVSSNKRMNRN